MAKKTKVKAKVKKLVKPPVVYDVRLVLYTYMFKDKNTGEIQHESDLFDSYANALKHFEEFQGSQHCTFLGVKESIEVLRMRG